MSCGYPATLLKEQYRMHPQIAQFPNATFYNNKIQNGRTVGLPQLWHAHFRVYAFFDFPNGREDKEKGKSVSYEPQPQFLLLLQ